MRTARLRGLFAGIVGATASISAFPAVAFDLNLLGTTSAADQPDFHLVAQDIAAALDYKPLRPSAPEGLTGFDVGAFGSIVPTRSSAAWNNLVGNNVDVIGVAGIKGSKGLPFGLDVGAEYGHIPGTSASLYGAEARYALLEGTIATPAVSLRADYTRASGTHDIDYHSYGTDVSISKGLLFLTPYAGVGYTWSTVKVSPSSGLSTEDIDRPKFFAGVQFSMLVLLKTTLEYERTGGNNAFDLQFGVGL